MNRNIYALATPPGYSALAIIRVTGVDSHKILKKIFKPIAKRQKNYVATRGNFSNIDDVVCIKYPDKRSFTGERSFEIIFHGNPVIANLMFKRLESEGVVLANPGEFTLRSYLSGKINLVQAEAVSRLILSNSEKAAQAALKSLHDGFCDVIGDISDFVLKLFCEIEVRLNFPEDELLDNISWNYIRQELIEYIRKVNRILETGDIGFKIKKGIIIAICGMPNVGKSTLLNSICGEKKSLVYNLPGTTRDSIEATISIYGYNFTFIDTAGINLNVCDPVEEMGIEQTKKNMRNANIVLYIEDSQSDEVLALNNLQGFVLEIVNKIDVSCNCKGISAYTGKGVKVLLKSILLFVFFNTNIDIKNEVMANKRQRFEFEKIYKSFNVILSYLIVKNPNEDLIVEELNQINLSLKNLNGQDVKKQVLNEIFDRFCIGK